MKWFYGLLFVVLASSHAIGQEGIDPNILAKAEAGDVASQIQVSLKYDSGEGVTRDPVKATEWLRKAANQGSAIAENLLGRKCLYGEGVDQSASQAAAWFLKAAAQGNAEAQFNIGMLYDLGQGMQQDYAQAIDWYRKAAEQGNAGAQFNLGLMFAFGQGVTQDYARAIAWIRKAADQGNDKAQYALGTFYHHGQGVPVDYRQAAIWYQKAADQGNAKAACNLGTLYHYGTGVSRDDVEACFWLNLALKRGLKNDDQNFAQNMEKECASHLATDEIARIRARAALWSPEHAEEERQSSPSKVAEAEVPPSEFPLVVQIEKSTLSNLGEGNPEALLQADQMGAAPPVTVIFSAVINGEKHWYLSCDRENAHGETNLCTELIPGKYPGRWVHNRELLQVMVRDGGGFAWRFMDVRPNPNNPPPADDPIQLLAAYQFEVVRPKGKTDVDYPLVVHVYGATKLNLPNGSLPSRTNCTATSYLAYRVDINCTNSGAIQLYKGFVTVEASVDGSSSYFISCDAKWKWSKCSVLGPGLYPARWIDGQSRIAVLGMDGNEPKEIVYSVEKHPNLGEPPPARPPF